MPVCGRVAFAFFAIGSGTAALTLTKTAAAQDDCFVRLDTGTDMSGWKPSTTNPHGPATGWAVEDGALVGRQTAGQQGGILMTDKSYRDVEVVFQVKIDWGCDSGFFFRTTGGARAYQVTLDHLAESGVGTIWGEGFAQELRAIPYFLTEMGNAAVPAPNQTPGFDLAQWPTIWDPTEFNEVRARVEGNPPHIQVWISDLKVMDFTDAILRSEIDPQGPLAIQVHSGERWRENGAVRFRNIRVKDLTVPCDEPDPGTGGGAGAGGSAVGGGAGKGDSAGMGGSTTGGTGGSTSQAGGGTAGTGASAAGGTSPGAAGMTAGASGSAAETQGGAAGTNAGAPGSAIGGAASTPSGGRAGAAAAAPDPTAAEESGCACRAANHGRRANPLVSLLVVGLAAAWRRRRSSRRGSSC